MHAGLLMIRFVGLLPWLHLVLFGAFTMRAYAVLGYWPSFNRPDPKQLGFVLHHLAVFLSMLPALYSPLAIVPGAVVLWRKLGASREFRQAALVYGLGTTMAWALWGFDLGGLTEWMMD